MKKLLLPSGALALICACASLLITVVVVQGQMDGTAWLLSTICPLVIAFPSGMFFFWQREKLGNALHELSIVHAELAAMHRQLMHKAKHDNQTGLLNRESLVAALDTVSRSGLGCLLVIDADRFKDVNDKHGHPVGDLALVEIAAALRRGVRAGDSVGRVGGEEFAVVLPGAGEVEAAAVAERIRKEVERIDFRPGGIVVPLTVSLGGVAFYCGARSSAVLKIADERLYQAKRQGRNRAVLTTVNAAA